MMVDFKGKLSNEEINSTDQHWDKFLPIKDYCKYITMGVILNTR